MAQKPQKVFGIDRALWQASHASHIVEHGAGRFFLSWNGALFRIAFGQSGPPTDETGGFENPRFQVAVSVPPALAVDLRNALDRAIQQLQGHAPVSAAAEKPTNGNGGRATAN